MAMAVGHNALKNNMHCQCIACISSFKMSLPSAEGQKLEDFE